MTRRFASAHCAKPDALYELHADRLAILFATMQGDVQPAASLLGTSLGNVDDTFTAKPMTNP